MDAVAMNTQAARCFRRACEASDPLDQTIFIGLRQAWLALAQQVQQRAMERPHLILPAVAPDPGVREDRSRPTRAKRHKARPVRKSSSRTRQRNRAA